MLWWSWVQENARYLHSDRFMDAAPKSGDSPFWKAILSGKDIIREGACYIVGDGCSIDPWKEPWVPNVPNYKPQIITEPNESNVRVKDFIMQPGLWDFAKLNSQFSPTDVRLIFEINLPIRPKPDHWVWTPMASGNFSTRSAYLTAN